MGTGGGEIRSFRLRDGEDFEVSKLFNQIKAFGERLGETDEELKRSLPNGRAEPLLVYEYADGYSCTVELVIALAEDRKRTGSVKPVFEVVTRAGSRVESKVACDFKEVTDELSLAIRVLASLLGIVSELDQNPTFLDWVTVEEVREHTGQYW